MLTEQQKQERTKGIGGSDVAVILGKSTFKQSNGAVKTALDLYLEKIGEKQSNEIDPELSYWGNALEKPTIERYERDKKAKCSIIETTFVHPEHSWMRGNIDARIEPNAVLECKTVRADQVYKWKNKIPQAYLLQCAYYRMVLDADYVDLLALTGNWETISFHYDKNELLEQYIFDQCENFWLNHVKKRVPPKPTTLKEVQQLAQIIPDTSLVASPIMMDTVNQIKHNDRLIKYYQNENEELKLKVARSVANKSCLVTTGGDVLAKWIHRKEYKTVDVTKLRKSPNSDLRKLLDSQYSKTIPATNYLRIK